MRTVNIILFFPFLCYYLSVSDNTVHHSPEHSTIDYDQHGPSGISSDLARSNRFPPQLKRDSEMCTL